MSGRWLFVFFLLALVLCLGSGASVQAGKKSCASACVGNSCTFRDIPNARLGNATLSINDDCQLVVDNIGGSGQDGVIQAPLQSVYMQTTLATPNFSGSLTGTSAVIRQLGIVDGQPDQEIMLTRIVNFNDTQLRFNVDCSTIQVAGYSIDIFDGKHLVAHQELGVDPPLLIYPKEDLYTLACGIWPNGDVYTVARFKSPQPITVETSPTDPGPFTGDVVFVSALSPQNIPTQQTAIENIFFATGPVTMASMIAGSLPGAGLPCSGDCSADLEKNQRAVSRFMQKGWKGIKRCARQGKPVCPAPCPEFPTLEEAGVSPACYNLVGCYLDALALATLGNTWGADRCPDTSADACDTRRSRAGGSLVQQIFKRHRQDNTDKIPDDVAVCHNRIQRLGNECASDACDNIPDWVGAILGQ